MSSRTEVDDGVVEFVRRSLAGDGRIRDWKIETRPIPGGFDFDIRYRGALVVRCWLCVDRSLSEALWEAATQFVPDERVVLARPKGAPWLAGSIAPSAVLVAMADPSVLFEAGDLERCVAWALLEV
jgi:hypothetical protein